MEIKTILIILLIVSLVRGYTQTEKRRVIVPTDIENEPVNTQSLVRYLLYANQFEKEGIVATTYCWHRDKIADWRVYEILEAYAKVQTNLLKHVPGYPTNECLHSIVKHGYPNLGTEAVG